MITDLPPPDSWLIALRPSAGDAKPYGVYGGSMALGVDGEERLISVTTPTQSGCAG